jgi:hypothetical protein
MCFLSEFATILPNSGLYLFTLCFNSNLAVFPSERYVLLLFKDDDFETLSVALEMTDLLPIVSSITWSLISYWSSSDDEVSSIHITGPNFLGLL